MASEGDLRREVVRYIADALDVDESLLDDEFDVALYISGNWERETVNVSKEDYVFFWKEFVRRFGMYDEMLDFELYAKNKQYGRILRRIMRSLFQIGLIGYGGVLEQAKVKDLVAMAKSKVVPPEIKRTIYTN